MVFSLRLVNLVVVLATGLVLLEGANGFEHPVVSHRQPRQNAASQHCSLMDTRHEALDDFEHEHNEGQSPTSSSITSRRSALTKAVTTAAGALVLSPSASFAAKPNGLILTTAPNSGLRWTDAKVGSGEVLTSGSVCSIDYSMASTAGRFPSIYSTKNGDAPYRWVLGDGSTIAGIELAILGSDEDGIPPMRPGGIRRVIVPNSLGFNSLIQQNEKLSPASNNKKCLAGNEGSIGPIPPKDAPDGAYQRWYQFYCNPRIPYQPDLVLDIKLYGKRS
mmetsp:Transcript_34616/g.81612  ORF Transcript_34616/g.81612 Transcript_34616/m.81612 type:complete len:276 (+) Transcript_34616:101-928(+)